MQIYLITYFIVTGGYSGGLIYSLARLPIPTLPHKAMINHEFTLYPRKIRFGFLS